MKISAENKQAHGEYFRSLQVFVQMLQGSCKATERNFLSCMFSHNIRSHTNMFFKGAKRQKRHFRACLLTISGCIPICSWVQSDRKDVFVRAYSQYPVAYQSFEDLMVPSGPSSTSHSTFTMFVSM